ncbi:MAG: lipopolysaccharide heptosyltransferase II [Pseudohongiellaceae bacterium]
MKLLVIGPSWVGDMVMAQALFISLRQRYPGCSIDVLAPDWCRALLQRMPEVRAALPLPLAHGELALGKRWRLGRRLRAGAYDQAIVLPNSFKSALIPCFAGIPLRTGWRGEARGWLLNDCRRLDKNAFPLMVQRFVALASPPGAVLPAPLPWPALRADTVAAAAARQRLGLLAQKPVAELCPGAEFGPAKQWPARHHAQVAQTLVQRGWQVWLLGSARDAAVATAILQHMEPAAREHCHDLCGRTELGEAVDLLGETALVLSNDSGLMHIAAALARPLVVTYGSTSAAFTPPLAARVRQLTLGLPCSPCFKRECPLQHLDCLEKLEPARVLAAIDELLE